MNVVTPQRVVLDVELYASPGCSDPSSTAALLFGAHGLGHTALACALSARRTLLRTWQRARGRCTRHLVLLMAAGSGVDLRVRAALPGAVSRRGRLVSDRRRAQRARPALRARGGPRAARTSPSTSRRTRARATRAGVPGRRCPVPPHEHTTCKCVRARRRGLHRMEKCDPSRNKLLQSDNLCRSKVSLDHHACVPVSIGGIVARTRYPSRGVGCDGDGALC